MIDNYLSSRPGILNELRDYIDGLMLSDGHIELSYNNKTARYHQPCKYKEWVELINNYFLEYSVISNVDNGRKSYCWNAINKLIFQYRIKTRSYVEFKIMHDRWYSKYYNIDEYSEYYWHLDRESGEYFVWKKVVPKDILLTPDCVLNWYLGDGSLPKKTNRNNYRITISTQGFSKDDILFLSDLLYEVLDINFVVSKKNVLMVSNKHSMVSFLDYITYCDNIPNCYNYKFVQN